MNVGLDERWHEAGDRFPAPQPLAHDGGRHVGRRRLEQVNPRRRRVALLVRRAHARGQRRQPRRQRLERVPGARHHHEGRQLEDVRIALPRADVGERVRPRDEVDLRRAQAARMQPIERVGGVGRAGGAQLLVAGAQPRHAGHREARHREAMEGGRERLHRAMGWNVRRDDEHVLQVEGVARGDGRGQVPAMDRVESTAEQADASHSVSRCEARGARGVRPSTSFFHTASSSSGSPSPVTAETG